MSVTVSENKIYFVKALNEAISMKMQEEMADCTENAHTSLRHKIIMKQIAKGKCYEPGDKVVAIKRAILVAILAAVFALTSCTVAIVYRKKIAGFIERTFDNFISVSADNESSGDAGAYPTKIEKVFEFTYIPEGYEFKKKIEKNFAVAYIYKNTDEKEITIRQKVMEESKLRIDIEQGYTKVFTIDGTDIYLREDERINTYVFEYNSYMVQIQFQDKLSEEEFVKIINGIR